MSEKHPCDVYTELRQLYDACNTALFADRLPPCMLVLRAHRRAYGFFQPACWGPFHTERGGELDTLALNPAAFHDRTEEEVVSTLVHEMCHLWQEHYGEHPAKKGYHNAEWGQRMLTLGLYPSATGQPGGKRTGLRVSHYILDPGAFHTAYLALVTATAGPLLSWQEIPRLEPVKEQPKKVKHTCPTCGEVKAWAVMGTPLCCGSCETALVTEAKQLPLLGRDMALGTPMLTVVLGGEVVDTQTGEVR